MNTGNKEDVVVVKIQGSFCNTQCTFMAMQIKFIGVAVDPRF